MTTHLGSKDDSLYFKIVSSNLMFSFIFCLWRYEYYNTWTINTYVFRIPPPLPIRTIPHNHSNSLDTVGTMISSHSTRTQLPPTPSLPYLRLCTNAGMPFSWKEHLISNLFTWRFIGWPLSSSAWSLTFLGLFEGQNRSKNAYYLESTLQREMNSCFEALTFISQLLVPTFCPWR